MLFQVIPLFQTNSYQKCKTFVLLTQSSLFQTFFHELLRLLKTISYMLQGRRNGFQSRGCVGEGGHGTLKSIVGHDGWPTRKISNSRRSRMAKTIIYWPWWQLFNSSCFETLSFLPLPLFFLFDTQKSEEAMTPLLPPPPPPRPPPVSPALCCYYQMLR